MPKKNESKPGVAHHQTRTLPSRPPSPVLLQQDHRYGCASSTRLRRTSRPCTSTVRLRRVSQMQSHKVFFEPAEVVGSAPWSERSVLSIVGSTNFLLSLIWNNVAQVRCNSKDPCTRAARAPPKCTHMLAAEQYNNNCSSLTIHLRCPQHRSEPLKPRRTIAMMSSRVHHRRLGHGPRHRVLRCQTCAEKFRV